MKLTRYNYDGTSYEVTYHSRKNNHGTLLFFILGNVFLLIGIILCAIILKGRL